MVLALNQMPTPKTTINPRSGQFAKLRRRYLVRRAPMGSIIGAAAEVANRMLGVLVHHLRFQYLASASVLAILLLIAPSLDQSREIVVVAVLIGFTLVHNFAYARRLQAQLRNQVSDPRTRRHVIFGIGAASFLWGCLTWPLSVGHSIDFMSFLIVTIVLFSICLAVLSAGFYYQAMASAAFGGGISLGAKIAWLTPEIGPLLPLGFAVFMVTNFAYGLVIERQARAGVLLAMRSRRTSDNLSKVNRELALALAQTQLLASRDPLTQLRNRSAFERSVPELSRQFADRQLAIMLLDIDHFKAINDRFGHHTGDGVLIAISTALEQWENDVAGRLCGRWGGEEFIAVVALRKGEAISSVAENLRRRIQDLSDQLHWPDVICVTTSIGCAPLPSPDDFPQALCKADDMLYSAKEAGRNRWRLAA